MRSLTSSTCQTMTKKDLIEALANFDDNDVIFIDTGEEMSLPLNKVFGDKIADVPELANETLIILSIY